ncbi:MAG: histidine phosphatase family protein [Acidimicrobiales bacterium]
MSENPAFEADEAARPGLPPLVGPIVHRALLVPQQGTTELIFVRHAQPARLPDGTPKEQLMDPPLSDVGRRQAEAVAAALCTTTVAATYTSDLVRAVDTGAAIAARHNHDPVAWAELQEFQAFRHVPAGESVRQWVPPALLRGMGERFVRERTWDSFPYSEPGGEFRNRVASAIEAILGAHPGQRVVVACHGGVINAYVAHLWDTRADMLFNPAHGSISRIVAREDRRAVATLNELHHLRSGDDDLVDY